MVIVFDTVVDLWIAFDLEPMKVLPWHFSNTEQVEHELILINNIIECKHNTFSFTQNKVSLSRILLIKIFFLKVIG